MWFGGSHHSHLLHRTGPETGVRWSGTVVVALVPRSLCLLIFALVFRSSAEHGRPLFLVNDAHTHTHAHTRALSPELYCLSFCAHLSVVSSTSSVLCLFALPENF